MKIFLILVVARFVLATDGNEDGEDEIVQTPAGCVRCTREKLSEEGTEYRKCLGIKYAEANRFEDPIPVLPSTDPETPINSDNCPICYQGNNSFASSGSFNISEDCLFLHVFVPKDCGDGPLPVIFYIHGGMFEMGNGPKLPSYLLKKCAIVVTFNYRLSIFGFLSTGTCDCPGNAGMKDCLVALQWVNRNIASFGGDPEKVTLYGLSAGAAIASYFQLNPQACGLFSNVILESGAFSAPWASVPPKKAKENSIKIGALVGCTDPTKLCSCLKTIPANLLIEKTKELITVSELMTFSIIAFAPTVENSQCKNTFITKDPMDLALKGLVCPGTKIMLGLAEEESCVFTNMIGQSKDYLAPLTALAYRIAPQCLSQTTNFLCIAYMTKEIVAHYTKFDLIFNEKNILQLISSVQFVLPMMQYAKLMAKLGLDVFVYQFSYVGPCSVASLMGSSEKTCHGEQLMYMFTTPLTQFCKLFQSNNNDAIVSENLLRLYSNFITKGCPTPDDSDVGVIWPKWLPTNQNYLNFNLDLTVRSGLQNSEMSFWGNLFDKCFLDILGIILNPNGQSCCSTCPKELNPCVS